MKLIFKGKVELGDDCRTGYNNLSDGAVIIGCIDVIKEVYDTFNSDQKVTVGIASKDFDGELFVQCGWGYSEYTPMEQDELRVGEHNIIDILSDYEDEEVTLFISDSPINLLEEMTE